MNCCPSCSTSMGRTSASGGRALMRASNASHGVRSIRSSNHTITALQKRSSGSPPGSTPTSAHEPSMPAQLFAAVATIRWTAQ